MNDIRVLCVENHLEELAVLQEILEAIGYEVMAATTARQALDLVRRRPIDGVLLDYDLPDANGLSLRAEIKRIRPHIPVLMLAGVGTQTPSLLRFFDRYMRDPEQPVDALDGLDA
jgi:CheY-like chemotaxis protein